MICDVFGFNSRWKIQSHTMQSFWRLIDFHFDDASICIFVGDTFPGFVFQQPDTFDIQLQTDNVQLCLKQPLLGVSFCEKLHILQTAII